MMASRSGDDDAGCSSRGISYELRARDLPSKRLLGKGLASIAYETEWNGERFARKDFIGVPSGSFQKEASILVGLEDHKNVVKTHGWTVGKLSCSLVLEYVEEDLLDLLQKRKESLKRQTETGRQTGYLRDHLSKIKESPKIPAGIASGSQSERNHTYSLELAEALDIMDEDPLNIMDEDLLDIMDEYPLDIMDEDLLDLLQKRKVSLNLLDLLQKRKESLKRPAGIASGSQSERYRTYPFDLAEALDIVVQIARGMEFLHAHHISHGDLKTKNILVTHTDDGDKKLLLVKVADFGLVRTKSKSVSFVSRQARKLDMVQWQAPEILERLLSEDKEETSSESDSDPEKQCAGPPRVIDGRAADVYSFAVTCSQILTGEDPYPSRNWKELGPKIVSGELRPNFPPGFPPLLLTFILEPCWRKVPAERPTFSSILASLDLLHDPIVMKYHAASIGGHAIDGCGEFMPGGNDGATDSLRCAACNCHRNFHRREVEGEVLCDCKKKPKLLPSVGALSSPHSSPAGGTPMTTTTSTLVLPPSQLGQMKPLTMAALSAGGGPIDSDEPDDGPGNSGGMMMCMRSPIPIKKRYRTKFSTEQKDQMCAFADRVGWRIQKHDEAAVQEFCTNAGLNRHVLKVWMHNNKHTMGKKS